MQIPRLTERVRVRGSDILYFVTAVDEEQQIVNLIPVYGRGRSLDAVPFSELVRCRDTTSADHP